MRQAQRSGSGQVQTIVPCTYVYETETPKPVIGTNAGNGKDAAKMDIALDQFFA